MELKYASTGKITAVANGFNRTFMELKYIWADSKGNLALF